MINRCQASPEFRNLLFSSLFPSSLLFPLIADIYDFSKGVRKGTRWLKEHHVIIVSNNDNRPFECNYTCRNILSYYCDWKENSYMKNIKQVVITVKYNLKLRCFLFFFSQFSLTNGKRDETTKGEAGITTRHSIGNKENYIGKLVGEEIRTILAGCWPFRRLPQWPYLLVPANEWQTTWREQERSPASVDAGIFSGTPSCERTRDEIAWRPVHVGHAARDLVNRAPFLLVGFLINASHRCFLRLVGKHGLPRGDHWKIKPR